MYPFKRLLGLSAIFLLLACSNSTEPSRGTGTVRGTVRRAPPGTLAAVASARILTSGRLLATTDTSGAYSADGLSAGSYALTCSATHFRDTTFQVTVTAGGTTVQDFSLKPDATVGRVYGEFQDGTLWAQAVTADTTIAGWTDEEAYDGTTGATLQYKWLQTEVSDLNVLIGDSLVAMGDGFGQFWFSMPEGTYTVRGASEGYVDASKTVTVTGGNRTYISLILQRSR
jgi:hypothetical protein